MSKFHINSNGDVKPCTAKKNKCRFGGDSGTEQHFTNQKEAEEFLAKSFDVIPEKIKKQKKEKKLFITDKDFGKPDNIVQALTEEEISSIPTAGINCLNCEAQLNAYQIAAILKYKNTTCQKCKKSLATPEAAYHKDNCSELTFVVDKNKSTFPAFEKENVYEMSWSHATEKDNWDSQLTKDEGFYSHLGSEQAAFDRMAANSEKKNEGFWVYEVKIMKEAKIANSIEDDEDQDWSKNSDKNKLILGNRKYGNFEKDLDAVRYKNAWEDLASISLIANSKILEITNKRFVSAEERNTRPSFYNIKLD